MSKKLVMVAALVAWGLAGCSAPPTAQAPSLTPAPAPGETEAPEPPVATALELSGTALQILNDDGTVVDFPFTSSPEPVIAALTAAIGSDPAISKYDTCCLPSHTLTEWEGLTMITEYGFHPTGQQFSLTFTAPTTGPLSLRTVDGVTIGDTVEDSLAAIDGEEHRELNFEGYDFETIAFDIQKEAQSNDDWGGFINSEDDVITRIESPVLYGVTED